MKARFSEFSYGFALSYEIMNALQPAIVGAPLFPSLLQEAESGYDVSFDPAGWPLFLQFKVADYLKTRRSKYWFDYHMPYFRVPIHKRKHSRQHNLLRELSRIEPEVYYTSPAFYLESEFNQAFASDCILMESMFFPLSELPDLIDDEQHHITYCKDVPGFHWHSDKEERFRMPISGRYWLERLKERLVKPRRLGIEYFYTLRMDLVKIITQQRDQIGPFFHDLPERLDDWTERIIIRDLRYLLVTYFGVETIVLRPPQ